MNTVKVKIDDVEVELKVVKPTSAQRAESEKIKSKKFRAAIENGDYLKGELKNILKKRGQWSDESDAELKELEKKVDDGCRRLNEGGFELEEAKKLAYDISSWRIQMVNLLSVYADATDLTAEGQADNAAFDYLVSVCAVYNDSGKPFSDIRVTIKKGRVSKIERPDTDTRPPLPAVAAGKHLGKQFSRSLLFDLQKRSKLNWP